MGVNNNTKDIFNLESNVATYWKSFPVEFTNAKGTKIYDKDKNEYLDFMSACGSLNYGHNEDSQSMGSGDRNRTSSKVQRSLPPSKVCRYF